MSAGRFGDLRATPVVLPLLGDPDSTVRVAAAFALGLLRDTAAARPLMDRLTGLPALDATSAAEAVTALAKIGGPAVGDFFNGILTGRVTLSVADREPVVRATLLDSWRLGRRPAQALLPFADDSSVSCRWRAAFSLGRLRPAAGERLTVLLRDREVVVRAIAARALTAVAPGGTRARDGGGAAGAFGVRPGRSGSDQRVRSSADIETPLVTFVAPLLGDQLPTSRSRRRPPRPSGRRGARGYWPGSPRQGLFAVRRGRCRAGRADRRPSPRPPALEELRRLAGAPPPRRAPPSPALAPRRGF
jgi:hypothetical protein